MRYQKIPDALLRSSKLSGDDIRVYGLLLSFAYKGKSGPARSALGEIIGKSDRTITRILRRLIDLGLIEPLPGGNPTNPTKYLIVKDIPKDICDPKHLNVGWGKILDNIKETKALRRDREESRVDTNGYTPWTPSSTPLATSDYTPRHQCPDPLQPVSTPSVHLDVPLNDSLDQTTFEREGLPYALARMGGGEPAAETKQIDTDVDEKVSCLVVQRFGASDNGNGTNEIENRENSPVSSGEENRMPENEKQKKERLERQKKLRQGQRTRFNQTRDITDEGKSRRSSMAGMTEEERDRARYKKKDAAEAAREAPIPDPETVAEVPGNPHGLIKHFIRVLMKHSPEAKYRPLKKDYSWAKELLKQFNREELYEMIQLIVLDWNNAHHVTSLWPKRSAGEYPNMKYLYFWSQTLVNFIGKGITEGSANRFSPYASDWAERNGLTPTDTSEDPIADELRAQLRKQAED